MALVAEYLRQGVRNNTVTAIDANCTAAGLRRLCLLSASLGHPVLGTTTGLRPVWRIIKGWRLALPAEFRTPVPLKLLLALAVWAESIN